MEPSSCPHRDYTIHATPPFFSFPSGSCAIIINLGMAGGLEDLVGLQQ